MTKQKQNDEEKVGRFKRMSQNVSNRVNGEPGSALWLVRCGIEWVHEFISAANSMMAARRAQKKIDTIQDEFNQAEEESLIIAETVKGIKR